MPSTSETHCNFPPPSAPHLFSSFSCCKLILFLFFSHSTPLHLSASGDHLEITRLLVESKADVAARNKCFSPPPSHHLSLTVCLAAMNTLHSKSPTTAAKRRWKHTCAASARLKEEVGVVVLEEHSPCCATTTSKKINREFAINTSHILFQGVNSPPFRFSSLRT